VGPPEIIDLAALRARAASGAQDARRSVPEIATETSRVPTWEPDASESAARPPRTLKTLLFADFAGYGLLHDVNAARFQGEFWTLAARQIASSAAKPLFANTWGDGLYLVFELAEEGASFALRLSEDMRGTDWATLGLPDMSRIRICLHAGPVFCAFDPIICRDNYFGSSVTHAARIEPITPPGTVFASEAFAAHAGRFRTGRLRARVRRLVRLARDSVSHASTGGVWLSAHAPATPARLTRFATTCGSSELFSTLLVWRHMVEFDFPASAGHASRARRIVLHAVLCGIALPATCVACPGATQDLAHRLSRCRFVINPGL
jgi:class 3 adenylate cyclase